MVLALVSNSSLQWNFFYNGNLKVTIDVPVLEENAEVYRPFAVVLSQGVYEVLNEFE